ncbi:Cysteine-rich secretory protein-related protein [Dioscorea alata]|uniref:Cysteine-rich secretory protein-related protein n=1 Tax=Dioscorea alata TaxID=55571 RepID=A0ACB7VHR4_DIOAL|nr:Cysteine-rich secretory protein-related protein [Dioscorea alata]
MAGHAVAQNSPDDFVNAHNSARNMVGVGPVTWDDTVAAYAKNYADQRIGDCELIHSNGPYGENLFGGSGADYSATDAVNAWVSEGQDYDYNSNTCAEGKVCGHYTQVVWKGSQQALVVLMWCVTMVASSSPATITLLVMSLVSALIRRIILGLHQSNYLTIYLSIYLKALC